MKISLIADKIKSLRQERAWSQAQLAEIASISIRTVSLTILFAYAIDENFNVR